MENTKNWAEAPPELLGVIAECLNSIEDCVRFSGVCRSWKSVIVEKCRSNVFLKTLPWMLYPLYEKDEDGNYVDGNNVFSLSERKFYKLNLPRNCFYSGSPCGFLAIIHSDKLEILNPLSHARFPLPLISTFKGYCGLRFIRKAIIAVPSSFSSTIPTKDQLIVFVIFKGDGELAFARPGDSTWTSIEVPNTTYDDILEFNNQFYVVDTEGVVRYLDITSTSPVGIEFTLPPENIEEGGDGDEHCTFYLVELLDELHMVVKYLYYDMELPESPTDRPFEKDHMYYFRAFKLDSGTRKWTEVFSLGDYAIFIGRGTSLSLKVCDFPECKASSIYFTDHLPGDTQSGGDMGLYHLDNKEWESWYDPGPLYSVPVWFVPSLC